MLTAIEASPHFNPSGLSPSGRSLRELQCKGTNCCGGAVKVDSELVEKLEQLRVRLGKPVA